MTKDKLGLALAALLADNRSGSSAMLGHLIVAMESWLGDDTGITPGERIERLRKYLERIPLLFPHFAVLHHFSDSLVNFLSAASPEAGLSSLPRWLSVYRLEWEQRTAGLIRRMAADLQFTGKTVLLHSRSSTVSGLFRELGRQGIFPRILQTESRPVFEGRDQAAELAGMGFEVSLLVDSAAVELVTTADMFITGADRIDDVFFVNKSGTMALTLLCREFGLPVYLLADPRKVGGMPAGIRENPRPPEEVWADPPAGVRVENRYFERISSGLVTAFYCS